MISKHNELKLTVRALVTWETRFSYLFKSYIEFGLALEVHTQLPLTSLSLDLSTFRHRKEIIHHVTQRHKSVGTRVFGSTLCA